MKTFMSNCNPEANQYLSLLDIILLDIVDIKNKYHSLLLLFFDLSFHRFWVIHENVHQHLVFNLGLAYSKNKFEMGLTTAWSSSSFDRWENGSTYGLY